MAEPAEDRIVHNLIEALDQLHQDLDRVELWAVALSHFQSPAPQYEPADQFILRPSSPMGVPPRPEI